jgi:hypothetical protein
MLTAHPVQVHIPWHSRSQFAYGYMEANLQQPEVHSCWWKTQRCVCHYFPPIVVVLTLAVRPGRRWQGLLPPHLLRDAWELVLWGLLQSLLLFVFSLSE